MPVLYASEIRDSLFRGRNDRKRDERARPLLQSMILATERTTADEWAEEQRTKGYSARVFERALGAGGARCTVYVIVVRERKAPHPTSIDAAAAREYRP